MKVALVHELLTMRGGAEKLLLALAAMYPDAPIYTLLYDEAKLGEWFPKDRVRTCVPMARTYNHHLYLRQFPAMVESWDFSEFDLVISTSSAFAHGIITNGKPKHLCYVNSPARYLWDRTHDVIDQAGKGPLGFLKRRYLEHTFHKLRTWDAEAAARPDMLLAASKEVQRRIELYWRRQSDVVYPFVDDEWLHLTTQQLNNSRSREHPHYFLILSTLVPYKRIDLAVRACSEAGVHLKVVGEGPDRKRLEKMAGPTVEFYGYRSKDELHDLVADAQAVIFPGEEDFGIVPLEAMAAGTPVIAYGKGGALETVIDGKTGCFFDEPTSESLMDVILSLACPEPAEGTKNDQKKYSKDACTTRAKEFSRTKFEEGVKNAVTKIMQ